MRIVGGHLRGRALAAPATRAIRPTSDRLRETIFNILDHRFAGVVTGARVIDLFAGTGALGFEALSRGAAFACLVDDGMEARAVLRANVEALGVAGSVRILRRDATRLGDGPGEPFTLAFLDPPYGKGLGEAGLAALRDGGWLAPDTICVVEEAISAAFVVPAGFEELDRREQGDTELCFCRRRVAAG